MIPRYDDNYEIVYEDRYNKSIFELFFHNKPSSIPEIKILLDKNGYYGRHKEWKVQEYGKITDKVKIEIYLPYSNYYYTWPLDNWYNIEAHMLHKKHKKYKGAKKEYTWMGYVLYHLHDDQVVKYNDINSKTSAMVDFCAVKKEPCKKALMTVIKAGLLTEDYRCRIHKKDIQEVYDNYFNEELIEFLT